jgi:mono/diheme cytochrome c family protein
LVLVLLPPFLAGSNHTCPVLREKDLEQGPNAQAIPAFARKYNVDCTYCHTAWPQLNRQGYIFRRLGYRMPWEVPTGGRAPSAVAPAPAAITPPGPQPPSGTGVPPSVASGLKKAVTGGQKAPASPEKVAEGQKVFQQMQCFTCHVNGENVINPSKPIKGEKFRSTYPEDEQIAQVIRRGIPGTAMPAYDKDRLSDAQLEALIAYVRSLTP